MNQIDEVEWVKMYDIEMLCETRFSVDEFESAYGLTFEAYEEDGLGPCFSVHAEIDGEKYFLRGYGARDSKDAGVTIHMQGNNPSATRSIKSIVKALNVSALDLEWIQDSFTTPRWILLRQGEDGHEVQITRFFRKHVAESVLKIFENRGHKQFYQVREKI